MSSRPAVSSSVGAPPPGHHPAFLREPGQVLGLHEESPRHALEVPAGEGVLVREGEDPQVLLFGEQGEGLLAEGGGGDDLQEEVRQGVDGGGVAGDVEDHDAAEGREGVGGPGPLEGRGGVLADPHPAGVGVLDDGGGGAGQFADQRPGAVQVQEVVEGEFLPLELAEGRQEPIPLPVEGGLLLGVLAVPQVLDLAEVQRKELGEGPPVPKEVLSLHPHVSEVARDGPVVPRRALEGLGRQA